MKQTLFKMLDVSGDISITICALVFGAQSIYLYDQDEEKSTFNLLTVIVGVTFSYWALSAVFNKYFLQYLFTNAIAPLPSDKKQNTILSEQLVHGVFDIDGMALILKAYSLKRTDLLQATTHLYVLGGYEDFSVLLRTAKQTGQSFFIHSNELTFICRDYEPHFIAGKLWFDSKAEILYSLILDSTPFENKMYAKKWLSLLKEEFPDQKIQMITNFEGIQRDDYSCKIFSINMALSLLKQNSYDLFKVLEIKKPSIKEEEYSVLPKYGMLPFMMKDAQSNTLLNEYINHSNNSFAIGNLKKSIEKHSVFVNTKYQNFRIQHKKKKYENLVTQHFKNLEDQEAKEAVLVFTGLKFFMQHKINYANIANNSIDIHLIDQSTNTYQVNIKNTKDKYKEFSELAYHDSHATVFFKKPREVALQATQLPWREYRKQLSQDLVLGRTWLNVDKHNISYDADANGATIIGNISNLMALFSESKTRIENDILETLNAGCAQPLAAYAASESITTELMHYSKLRG